MAENNFGPEQQKRYIEAHKNLTNSLIKADEKREEKKLEDLTEDKSYTQPVVLAMIRDFYRDGLEYFNEKHFPNQEDPEYKSYLNRVFFEHIDRIYRKYVDKAKKFGYDIGNYPDTLEEMVK